MARPLIRDNHGASTFWSFIGVLILSIAILGVYFGYVVPKFGTPPIRAQAGDTVQADYVGTVTDFEALYNLPPVSGSNVTDPFWGWPSTVAVSGSLVALTNSPFLGQIVRPYNGWDAEVVSIDDSANQGEGTILVHHLLTPSDVDRTGGKALQRGTMVPLFVVSAVDLDAGTYTLNYNVAAPYGRTLVFQVTMVSISRLF